jgi:tRNA(Ile)-lysidine synthase TilS/MesJ
MRVCISSGKDSFVLILVLQRAAARIAVTQMHDRRHGDAVEAAIERLGAMGADLVVIARHGGFVDL